MATWFDNCMLLQANNLARNADFILEGSGQEIKPLFLWVEEMQHICVVPHFCVAW